MIAIKEKKDTEKKDIRSKIRLENVSFVYGKKTPFEIKALDDVSLDIEENKITGIIGHTGSGKSTMMQLLNGLAKPASGKVYLDGKDIWEDPKKISEIRFKVGLVMQYPEYQLFEDTVAKDIAYGPSNMGLKKDEVERRVLNSARTVGLDPALLAKSPFDLSGGEKRRAAVAGIMAMTPEVMVFDEPAAGLDPVGRNTIFDAVMRYKEENNATIIIASHSMEDMARICDNIIVLSGGKLLMSGKTKDVFSRSEELYSNGLDIPEISKVMIMLKNSGVKMDEIPYTVDDAAALLGKGS